ncbi:TetR/AcrR family transcriptional regulator [Streptomonospora sediminis]
MGTETEHDGTAVNAPGDRPLRADARRNRDRVLEVAQQVFAAEGLAVPVHEIARRAGVGTGTVSRHFPTKQALFKAILLERMNRYVGRAEELAADAEPGEAFFAFFAFLVQESAMDRGMTDALSGTDDEKAALVADPEHDVMGAMERLLVRAQQAGAVRPDIEVADVKALVVACLSRSPEPGCTDESALRRLVSVACAGLRTDS